MSFRTPLMIAAFVAGAAFNAAAQQPTISPLHWMRGNMSTGTSREMQQTPAVCWGTDSYLAAWSDGRSRVPSEFGTQNDDDIYAARIDTSGNLIDSVPIAVASGYGFQRDAQVSWNGSNWLVAWTGQSSTGSYYDVRVWATRVSSSGTVLDTPFQIVPLGSSYTHPFSLASNGSDWCVVTQSDSGSGLVASRVSAAGVVLDPAGVVLAPPKYYLYFGERITSVGGEYLLAYADLLAGNVAQRFSSTLTPIGTTFSVPGLAVGSNGSNYYVLWTDSTSLVGSPMSFNGTLSIPTGAVLVPNAGGISEIAEPSWDGTNWWAAWNHNGAPIAARVAANGAVLDVNGFEVDPTHSTYTYNVTVGASAQGGAQVMWTDGRTELWDVFGVHAAANAQLDSARAMALSAGPERRPKLAAGPNGQSLAVAVSEFAEVHRILAWRLDAAGQALDAQPIEVAISPTASTPSVAFDGTRYLIAWYSNGSVLGRRMLPNGVFLDVTPFVVMPGWAPDVAALGGVFLVVDINAPGNPQYAGTYSRRVDGASGAVLDPAPVLISGSYTTTVDVTRFGARWLCVTQQNFSHDDAQSGVVAVFVDANGAPTQPISVVFAGGGAPAVEVVGTKAFIAYRTGSSASANNDLAARIMNDDGSFSTNTIMISTASGAGWAKQFAPAVAWDGVNFVVAWEDQRNQANFFDARSDIYAARVDVNGLVLDPNAFPLANAPEPECYPTLLANSGAVLFAASILRADPPFAAYRLGTRVIFEGCPTPVAYCSAAPNSSGSSATISFSGSASFSQNALTLGCTQLPPSGTALFFHGAKALSPATPFGNGLLCAGGTVRRLPPLTFAGGNATQLQDLNWSAYAGMQPGDTRFFQFWFRDVAGGGSGFNLSNALAVTFCP